MGAIKINGKMINYFGDLEKNLNAETKNVNK